MSFNGAIWASSHSSNCSAFTFEILIPKSSGSLACDMVIPLISMSLNCAICFSLKSFRHHLNGQRAELLSREVLAVCERLHTLRDGHREGLAVNDAVAVTMNGGCCFGKLRPRKDDDRHCDNIAYAVQFNGAYCNPYRFTARLFKSLFSFSWLPAIAASVCGARIMIQPRLIATRFRRTQICKCLLTLSRVVPKISLILC